MMRSAGEKLGVPAAGQGDGAGAASTPGGHSAVAGSMMPVTSGDLVGGKATELGVAADQGFVRGVIDAVDLVAP